MQAVDESLLSYYNRELAYLRKEGAAFAKKHPKIAGRLRLDRDLVEDPHVSRLIEAFAFLTARIRHQLDDSFPELTEALMGLLYPDYHAPIPSLSIAQIRLLPERLESRLVPAGTRFSARAGQLGTCLYRSCYDTAIHPVSVISAHFQGQPFKAPPLPPFASKAQAVMRLELKTETGTSLSQLGLTSLRFFLNGQPQLSYRLYEYLLHRATSIAIARDPADPAPIYLLPTALKPRGIATSDAVLPGDGRSSAGHRLLTEFFVFPEKFLFVEIDIPDATWAGFGEQAIIYIHFDQCHPELAQGVSAESLLLGCTPIVNLFEEHIALIASRDLGYENRLRVDENYSVCADIHSLTTLYAEDDSGNRIEIQPFYGSHRHRGEKAGEPLYWHLRREASRWHDGRPSEGGDCYLSLVDRDFDVTRPDGDWIIGGRALCTNRDLPGHLPFGPDEPALQFWQGGANLRIRCVTPPTPTLQPTIGDATRWQLVTQLSLQHFSGDDGLQTLRETLRLYDFKQLPESRAVIDGIVGLRASMTTARVARGGRASLCQGTAFEVELDERFFSGAGLYLFSGILSEFLAHFCAINTFVQLTVVARQRPGRIIKWPPRSGNQPLI